jgi:hypothetical protein
VERSPADGSPLTEVGRRALAAFVARPGVDLAPLAAALVAAPRGPEADAWRLALDLLGGKAIDPAVLRPFRAGSGRAAAAELAAVCARRSCLELEAEALARWLDLLDELTGLGADGVGAQAAPGAPPHAASDARLGLQLELGRAWLELLRGGSGVGERAQRAGGLASAAHLGGPLVEATALRALAALVAGEIGAATAHARRASLMAASEQLDEQITLANLVLARVRRHAGRPHLATRIAGQIARLAHPWFHAWLRWEAALAGGADPELAGRGAGAFGEAVDALAAWLAAAGVADPQGAARHADELRGALAHAAPFRVEAEVLLLAATPGAAAPPGREPLGSWWRGGSPMPPFGLHGLCRAAKDGASGDTTACVLVRPGEAGRRVLRLGLERGAARAGSAVTGERDQAHSRTDMGLAVLGLAGPAGLDVGEFFQTVYGFPHQGPLHRGILNVLVHRMRKRIEGAGSVERDEDHLRLEVSEAFAVLDARCSEPALQRVLWLLARRGTATAKDAAQLLGMPLRTAQAALQQLAADGTCTVAKDGKQLAYRLDDTTFSEPTPDVPAKAE